ncbi:SH24A protein, partial [Polyodon spathula]|nr:SH24A protein [Polyodon spathula]
MLEQILADMWIEPELLAELNEEQKQILFFKMREEQVRRWKEKEALLEKEQSLEKKSKKANEKSVKWLLGSDNDVWVWVMGEHLQDKTYDQICDDIMAERARQQAQREAEEIRKKNEEELVKRFSNALSLEPQIDSSLDSWKKAAVEEEQARLSEAAEQKRTELELKMREEEERRQHEEKLKRLEEERTQQIYMDLKEVQQTVQKSEDKEWQESLRKSKAADVRRRSIAKQARDDHKRHSLKAVEHGRVAAMSKAFGGGKPLPPKPKPRNNTHKTGSLSVGSAVHTSSLQISPCNIFPVVISSKAGLRRTLSTSTREVIIRWFKEEQIPRRAGYEKHSEHLAPWFHGIISREEAEDLLRSKGQGSFLIRVSEKIMGYVLSYRCQDSFKHFLIDASEDSYCFLGVEQLVHSTLSDLVEYHK